MKLSGLKYYFIAYALFIAGITSSFAASNSGGYVPIASISVLSNSSGPYFLYPSLSPLVYVQNVGAYYYASTCPGTTDANLYVAATVGCYVRQNQPSIYATTAPLSPNNGQIWVNTSSSPWTYNVWDSASWVKIGSLNTTSHIFSSSTVESKTSNYTVTASDVASGTLYLDVDATAGAVTITIPPSLGLSSTSPMVIISKIDTTYNVVSISDGTHTLDYIVSPAGSYGQINGYRDIYSNGTNLRSEGAG